MKRMISGKKPACYLMGVTGLIFLLLLCAFWLERLWSQSPSYLPAVIALWQSTLFFAYLLIVCGSVCCWSMDRYRCWKGYTWYLPWAAVMTLLFTQCFLTEWLTFSDLLVMTLCFLPQPLVAGGVLSFLAYRLCPGQKKVGITHCGKPARYLIGVTGLIFLLLLFAFWLEHLWGRALDYMMMETVLWQGTLLGAYLLIACGSICCWRMCQYRCQNGFLWYLPWAVAMTLLFLLCFMSGSLSFSEWLVILLCYLPQPLAAGGVVIFLAHCLCSERKETPTR